MAKDYSDLGTDSHASSWVSWSDYEADLLHLLTMLLHRLCSDGSAPIPTTISAGQEATTTIWETTGTGSASGTRTVYLTTTLTTSTPTSSPSGVIHTTTTTTTTSATRGTLTPSPTYPPESDDDGSKYIPRFAACRPGDEDYKEPGVLSLTREQRTTLAALAVMFLVILIGWNFVILRYLFYPLKVGLPPVSA